MNFVRVMLQTLQGVAVATVTFGVFALTRSDLYAPKKFTKQRVSYARWTARVSISIIGTSLLLVLFMPHSWRHDSTDILSIVILTTSIGIVWGLGRCISLFASRANADILSTEIRSTTGLYIFVLLASAIEFTTHLLSSNTNMLLRTVFGNTTWPYGNVISFILPFGYLIVLGLMVSRLRQLGTELRIISRKKMVS